MTTPAQTPIIGYNAVGTTILFAFPFRVLDAAYLVVLLNGVPATGYTVTLGDINGGSITFAAAPTGTLVIYRDTPVSRAGDYGTLGDFKAVNVNEDLDRVLMLLQESRYVQNARGLRAPAGETVLDLPAKAARAGYTLSFDSNGNPVMVTPVSGSSGALATDLSLSGVGGKGGGQVGWDYATSYSAGSVGAKLNRAYLDLDDFAGATDWAKMTAAAAVCKLTGRALRLPSRPININSDLGSIVLEQITLLSEQVLDGANSTVDAGAVFWITGTTNSPFKIRRGVTLDGVGFYYPSQGDTATPTVYPYTLDFDFSSPAAGGSVQFVYIKNCVVFNAYNFCRMDNGATGGVGHIFIEDNTIFAFNTSINIRYNAENIRIVNNTFEFGHWLAATEAGARAYYRANATVIKVDQSDGVFIHNNLIFGALNGVLCSAVGTVSLMRITGNSFDQCRYGVKATGAGTFSGVIDGNDFYTLNTQNTSLQGRSISIDTAGAGLETIIIGANNFVLSTEEHLYIAGNTPTRAVTIQASTWALWGYLKAAGTYGALNVGGNNTSVTVVGGFFYGLPYAAFASGIVGSLNTFQCNGATFLGCKNALAVTANSISGAGNVSYSTNAAASDVMSATTLAWGPNAFDKPNAKTTIQVPMGLFSNNTSYANDAAAAAASIPVGGMYRNGSVVQVRVV